MPTWSAMHAYGTCLAYLLIISSSRHARMLRRPRMLTSRLGLRNILIAVLATLPIALLSSVALRTHKGEGEITLVADISQRTLTVRENGEVLKVYDIAVGSERHPTPPGEYSIHKIVWNPAWIPPDRA